MRSLILLLLFLSYNCFSIENKTKIINKLSISEQVFISMEVANFAGQCYVIKAIEESSDKNSPIQEVANLFYKAYGKDSKIRCEMSINAFEEYKKIIDSSN